LSNGCNSTCRPQKHDYVGYTNGSTQRQRKRYRIVEHSFLPTLTISTAANPNKYIA
jgi:hypothetical protein